MKVSFWLIPEPTDRARLAAQINDLALRYGAPPFTPHVTLYSGRMSDADAAIAALDAAANQFSALSLVCTGVDCSPEFTKTLFLTFDRTTELTRMSALLQQHGREPYDLNPHLSLIYATLRLETKLALTREIELPPSVCFASVQAVLTGEKTAAPEHVEKWKWIAERELRSA